MKYPKDYFWLNSYLDNESLWVEDSISWDTVFHLAATDYSTLAFLTNPVFLFTFVLFDEVLSCSFYDLLFIRDSEERKKSKEFFELLMWDLSVFLDTNILPSQFFFYMNQQDLIVIILHQSPELSLALLELKKSYWFNFLINLIPASCFEVFSDPAMDLLSEALNYAIAFILFAWGVLFFMEILRILKWNNLIEVYLVRFHSFLFSLSRENRLQLEAVLTTIFIFVLYVAMMTATFDDDQEELFEIFINLSFYCFAGAFIYFIYRYSVHYLSFLAATDSKSSSLSLLSQFAFDFLDTIGLLLRFIVLMARLNLYDFLDDLLDSYYIFLCDFDEDEYLLDLIISTSSIIFDGDLQDDRTLLFEDENDLFSDLFSIYFNFWARFAFFFCFAIEECLRVSLAFFVTYLIIFEVQAVNRSYIEDTYLFKKRQRFSSKVVFPTNFKN